MTGSQTIHWTCICGRAYRLRASCFPLICPCGKKTLSISDGATSRVQPTRDVVKFPCQQLGKFQRLEECRTCRTIKHIKVFACAARGECTLGKQLPGGIACCKSCGLYAPRRPEWVTTGQLVADTLGIASRLPPDLAGILGVARSGIFPASLLAMHLHLPLWIVQQRQRAVAPAGHGYRLDSRGSRIGAQTAGKWLLIDDTTASGSSMREARALVAGAGFKDVLAAAIYPADPAGLDYFGRVLPLAHLLEWNFFNSVHVERSAFDFDGVLCLDGARPHDAAPLHLPRRLAVPLIVTGRPEAEREASLAWLSRHGVGAAQLVMWPGSLEERSQPMAVSRYKAKHYLASGLDWFVESCPIQAAEIAGLTGKPVICPPAAKVF